VERQNGQIPILYIDTGGAEMMKRRGYTLIELVVSMALFAVFSVIVISSFLSFAYIQARTSAMKESQQKLRTTLDFMVRQAKEADEVTIDAATNTLTLKYNTSNAYTSAVSYQLTGGRLIYRQCNVTSIISTYIPCTAAIGSVGFPEQDMLSSNGLNGSGNIDLVIGSGASRIEWNSPTNGTNDEKMNMPASIRIVLSGRSRYGGGVTTMFDDDFSLETLVMLERK
jgi:prepilin-type N-terminal cleavage/methylation domain-containing protein